MKKQLTISTVIYLYSLLCPVSILAGGDYFMPTDVGSSARMIRVGNIEGFNTMSSGVFENPAALYRINQVAISAFTTTLMNEVSYKNISIATKVPFGVLGLGYMTAGVTGIPHTYEQVYDPGTGSEFAVDRYFEYNNTMAKISYELSQTDTLHFGVSAVYYNTTLDTYKGQGYNFDAGLLIDVKGLSLSVSAKNIVPALKIKYSNGETETPPLQMAYGAKYRWGDFDALGQLKTVGSSRRLLKSFGLSYTPSFANFFEVSGGYKEVAVVQDVRSSFTLGVGLNVFDVSLDYAYESSDHIEYNSKHYFSVGIAY